MMRMVRTLMNVHYMHLVRKDTYVEIYQEAIYAKQSLVLKEKSPPSLIPEEG